MNHHRGHTRGGFLFVEAIAMVAMGLLLVAVLGRATLALVQMERSAREHSARISVTTHLAERLHRDLWQAADARFADDRLDINTGAPDSPAVRYEFTPDAVRRLVAGEERGIWQAKNLSFAWDSEPGSAGTVLVLHVVTVARPGRDPVPARVVPLAFALPTRTAEVLP